MTEQNMAVTREIAEKVRDVVDAGLVCGIGTPTPGQMCVEAAVCFAYGLPHSDNPPCVGRAVRSFKINLNDFKWSSAQARAKGMRAIAIAQLGSDQVDQQKFAELLAMKTVNILLPKMLRIRGLEDKAVACEKASTLAEARSAANAAYSAADAANAAYCADAAAYAADAAYAAYAANAADAAAYAADAADAADAAAYAAYCADAAAYAADAYAGDDMLTLSADLCLEVLLELGSPGCAYLDLLAE